MARDAKASQYDVRAVPPRITHHALRPVSRVAGGLDTVRRARCATPSTEVAMSIAERLRELNITLPAPPKPVAAYVPAVRTGNLLFISGQLPTVEGKLPQTGKVPAEVSPEQAQAA